MTKAKMPVIMRPIRAAGQAVDVGLWTDHPIKDGITPVVQRYGRAA